MPFESKFWPTFQYFKIEECCSQTEIMDYMSKFLLSNSKNE